MFRRTATFLFAAATLAFTSASCSNQGPKDCGPEQTISYATDPEGECRGLPGAECDFDIDCLEGLLCDGVAKECVEESLPHGAHEVVVGTVGGINVKSAVTGHDGNAFFTDDQDHEDVIVYFHDSGVPIAGAAVTFFDGDGFEGYIINHPHYSPIILPAAHNSTQNIAAAHTTHFRILDGNTKQNSEAASRKFLSYLSQHSPSLGCVDPNEVSINAQERIVALGELSGKVDGAEVGEKVATWGIKGLGKTRSLLTFLVDNGVVNGESCQSYLAADTNIGQWNVGPSLTLRIYECNDSPCQDLPCDPTQVAFQTCATSTSYEVVDECGGIIETVQCDPGEWCFGDNKGENAACYDEPPIPCEDECPTPKEQCIDEQSISVCGYVDNDPCLEKSVAYCTGGEVCVNDGPNAVQCVDPQNERYQDTGDGVVLDTQTGLYWQKKHSVGWFTWSQIITECETLTLGGNSNWRLPSAEELANIKKTDGSSSLLPEVFSSNAVTHASATSCDISGSEGYVAVHFEPDLSATQCFSAALGNNKYFRCVR